MSGTRNGERGRQTGAMRRFTLVLPLIPLTLLAGSAPGPAPAPVPASAPKPASSPAAAPAADPWAPVRFLLGDWIGEGSGEPGQGSGWTRFKFDLEGRIIRRINHAEYPPKPGEAKGTVHDDRMTLFPENGALKAIYFDNEGHVIRYLVSAEKENAVFTSEPGPGPRFKLVYHPLPDGRLRLDFFIAPPGGSFKPYLGALLKRGALPSGG